MLKLISLNIEGDNHYDKIVPFFEAQQPDVVCLMETYQVDLPFLKEKLQMEYQYLPLSVVSADNPFRKAKKGVEGIAIFSKLPFVSSGSFFYESQPADLTIRDSSPGGERHGCLFADIQKNGKTYRVVTTHFTWSPNGSVTDLQRADLKNLLGQLEPLSECVLCGDFNAPRGTEIFDTLASHFVDNVPKDVICSLDKTIHRVGNKLPDFMVDGFFTKNYQARNVRMVCGVSDHCAIVGEIEKN